MHPRATRARTFSRATARRRRCAAFTARPPYGETVGLLLQSVGGTDVRGMPYQGVLGLLKEKKEERPLTLHFEQSR